MSDPVTKVEIEDVLSSIRRLVSEDGRAPLRQSQAVDRGAAEKLVLTPALRVAEAPIAEMVEPDWAEDHVVAPFDGSGAQGSDTAFVPEPDAEMVDESWDDDAPDDGDAAPAEPDVSDASDAEDDAFQEAIENLGPRGDRGEDAPWTDPEATLYEAAGATASGAAAQPAEDTPTAGSLSEKIAALEAVIARTDDQWEPDGASQDAYAGTEVETLDWEDHTEAEDAPELDAAPEVAPEPEPQPEPEPRLRAKVQAEDPIEEDGEAEGLSLDDAILDEETLRILIAQIVREELQGSLGERITRNVRKLVRREIHRALAVQELE
jgi:hypothetical protein